MADLGTTQTTSYVLLMSFDKNAPREQLGNGGFGIATRDSQGNWANAVRLSPAGAPRLAKRLGSKQNDQAQKAGCSSPEGP
jgi:hypothetical protein